MTGILPVEARVPSGVSANASVGIIVVSYNTRDKTLACLDSVSSQEHRFRARLIVVDNDSRDGSAVAIREKFPKADVLEPGTNLGFARAVNLGADHSREDFILLLNPDALLMPGTLQTLIDFAEDHPEYGIFGGRIVDQAGVTDRSSCWGAPSMWSLICFATGLSTAFPGSPIFNPESLGRWERNTVREVPVVTGCLLLVRRRDFLAIGGMDPRYFLYSEDAEFCLRAKAMGYRSVLVPEAVIRHEGGAASRDNGGSKMCMVMAGKTTMLRATWPPAKADTGVWLLTVGSALRAAAEGAFKRERRMWTEVWKRRSAWQPGYPKARKLLFGAPGGHITPSGALGRNGTSHADQQPAAAKEIVT